MQDTIKRILEGNFDYENGSLDFSCVKLELSLPRGSVYEGSFRIASSSDGYTNGYITTSDIRMECLTPEFVGNDVEVSFRFHGEYMEEGDEVKGAFLVVSNQGEYSLPFMISIEHMVLDSSIGPIKNLFHFTNLAKSNWAEALKLFYSREFYRVFVGSDAPLYDCYRALSAHYGNEQNMEEFLIQINKKQHVEFLTDVEQLSLELPPVDNPYAVTEAEVGITRNGWGYTSLQIACEGDFVFTEKEFLADDDFLGNQCRLPVYVDSNLCRQGKNYGRIFIFNSYISLEIPVTVKLGESDAGKRDFLKRKRSISRMMELYLSYRLQKISFNTWQQETSAMIEHLVAVDENDVEVRLFQAQLLLLDERYNEAGWILEHTGELLERRQMEDTAQWAYYLYLTTLINREEEYLDWVAEAVELIYKRNRREWRVACILLYLLDEYDKSAADKWSFLEKQFRYGCTSPVLYMEALELINGNASVLRKVDGFGMQVLYYGAKQRELNADVVEQLLYLAGKEKEYSPILEKIFILLYEKKPDVRILQELCTLLIKGGKVGNKYFQWYEKGVQEGLRITNLYEHYMLSVDMQKIQSLPKIVLMYFMYQNNLDYERTSFLYYYILNHKEEYSELYANYRPRIEKFVVDQIQKRHINRYLAGLYQEVLSPGIVTEQTASSLAGLLFAHQITVADERLRKVIIYQPENEIATAYHLQGNRAWVALYGEDNVIVFEDAWGNRFVKSVEYTLEKLMSPGDYLPMLAHYAKDSNGLDIYLCEAQRNEEEITADSAARYHRLAVSAHASLAVKREAYMKLLQYYYNMDDVRAMEKYLEQIPLNILSHEERNEVVRHMVRAGKYEAVYNCIAKYGPYFAEPKILVYFADDMIRQLDYGEDAVLLATVVHAFRRGKYNSVLLQYLAKHFKGLTKDMRDIWKAARAFDSTCYELSERLLIQMLYSGAFVAEQMEIFRNYVSQGARHQVVEAVLAQYSYEFFVKEKLTEEYVFKEIYQAYSRGETVQRIAKLAFLKYYAENRRRIREEMKPVIEAFLQEMLEKKIYLNFFREYKEFAYLLKEMKDKVIIEYRSRSCKKAKIHYVVLHDNGDADEYLSQYMREAYTGVYFADFVLFFGESLQYYIMEENDGAEQLTESGSIQKSDTEMETEDTKYGMINDMIISKTLQDYDTLDNLLNEYYAKEFYNEHLFVLR